MDNTIVFSRSFLQHIKYIIPINNAIITTKHNPKIGTAGNENNVLVDRTDASLLSGPPKIGSNVGSVVGSNVGSNVGSYDGEIVGGIDGCLVGFNVGDNVGGLVSSGIVGFHVVGSLVGFSVGFLDGLVEGEMDGLLVGFIVIGDIDGASVSLRVSADDGCGVMKKKGGGTGGTNTSSANVGVSGSGQYEQL